MEQLKDLKWETISSEYLVRRPWLTARKDRVRLPNGQENDEYYVLEYPTWVNIIALTQDGMMLMERQYRHGLGQTIYEIPAGVMEEGEQPIEAAKRELWEETGYAGGEWEELMVASANPSCMNNLNHTFLACGVEKVSGQHLDRTEDLEVHLMTEAEVFALLEAGEIKQSLMAAPLWKYFYGRVTGRPASHSERI